MERGSWTWDEDKQELVPNTSADVERQAWLARMARSIEQIRRPPSVVRGRRG